jgi:hypothetical protein
LTGFFAAVSLVLAGAGQLPVKPSAGDPRELVERLREFAVRAGQPRHDAWDDAQCGTVGGSRLCWFYGESGLLVFGRSGGLLLRVDGRYPTDVETRDFDHDARPELTFVIRTGGGTGTLTLERHIYFFDGRRFAPALRVVSSAYTDSSWFGVLRRGNESFLVPMLSTTGEIRFRDTDGDGREDVAEAVERRWWGDQVDAAARRLASGPDWASNRLQQVHGLSLGEVNERVVRVWVRSADAAIFVRRGSLLRQTASAPISECWSPCRRSGVRGSDRGTVAR